MHRNDSTLLLSWVYFKPSSISSNLPYPFFYNLNFTRISVPHGLFLAALSSGESLGQCLEFGDIQKNKLSEWTKQVSLGLNAITFPQPNLQILPHLHPFLFSVVALVLLPYKETLPLGFWAPASFLASQGINPSLAILLLLSVSPNLKKNPLITTYYSTLSTPYFLRPLYS